ncbi:hypothetical protein BG004_005524, partial [Podila humilis]
MVTATRRRVYEGKSSSGGARILGKVAHVPSKRQHISTKNLVRSTHTTSPIATKDPHVSHTQDGHDHHVIEQDGQDRHHIWFKDFENDVDHNRSASTGNQAQSNQGDAFCLRDGTELHHLATTDVDAAPIATRPSPGSSTARMSKTKSSSSGRHSSAVAHTPLKITVDHKARRLHIDGKDNHEIEADGLDHHHIRFTSDEELRPSSSKKHSAKAISKKSSSSAKSTRPAAHDSESTMARHSSSNKADRGISFVHAETGESTTAMNHLDSVTISRDGYEATALYYQGNNSSTTKTTTTTTRNHDVQSEHSHRHTRDENMTRLITQKSQMDRQKAHDAILSLDNDLVQMQKLLHEKEEALRFAEARAIEFQQVTIRTETLTREIQELEITIRDLRTNLQVKEKALKETQLQLHEDHHKGQEEQKRLESEISKLHLHLHDKENLQIHSKEIQKDLDEANKQRARLIVQIREITEALKDRETALKGAHSSIKSLEKSNETHAKDVLNLSQELSAQKKVMKGREKELKECHRKIKALDGAQEKVHVLGLQLKNIHDQLTERQAVILDLEKDNRVLSKDNLRANKLSEEIRILRQDIDASELQLNKALKDARELNEYKDLANELQNEIKDLRDQVDVQEKHLTYLEDALQAHENCVEESQRLQDQIDSYGLLVREKETKIRNLQKTTKDLALKDSRIEALTNEIQGLRHDLHGKDSDILKLKEKAEKDIANISSTASALRVEVESLRQQLIDKAHEFVKVQEDHEKLANVHDTNMNLTVEITRLEKSIATKDKQIKDLDKMIGSMRVQEERASRLEDRIKELENENRHSKMAADQTARDLAASSSTASQLVVEVESLRQQLIEKEDRLRNADKVANELEQKSNHNTELLLKISSLEDSSDRHMKKARQAEDKVKDLKGDISSLQSRVNALQQELESKVTGLNDALNKANQDHEVTLERLEQMRSLVSQLKKQLKDAEKDATYERRYLQDQISSLTDELKCWEDHEVKWMEKANELTEQLETGHAMVRQKEKQIHDSKFKLTEKDSEIGRLNDAINHARGELASDRKRRASEIEEQVAEKTHQLRNDKGHLNEKIAGLEDQIVHLEKRIRLDDDHQVKEQELCQRVEELNVWKQNAIQQAKEWETTAVNFENDRKKREMVISSYKEEVTTLQIQLDNADALRRRAIEQAEQLTAMITKLGAELSMVKTVLAKHDANDAQMEHTVQTMSVTIETLEQTKNKLQVELAGRNGEIKRLELLLKQEAENFNSKQAAYRKDLESKERKIDSLHSRIAEYNRDNADLESKLAKDKDLMSQLGAVNDKLKGSLGAQMEQYKVLDNKYQVALSVQSGQDKKLYKLEKTLERVTAEDADKLAQARSRMRHLERELERNSEKIEGLKLQVHNATRQYHDTLAKLKHVMGKMDGMVPADEASHDVCAARIQDGERAVTELEERINDLEKTIVYMTKKMESQNGEWALAKSGYKDRIHKLSDSQNSLEVRLHAAEKGYDQERLSREQERLRAERESQKQEEQIQALQRVYQQLQQELSMMETRMRQEMSTTKDLTELLNKLRNSIKNDSEIELHNLDEIEKEIKTRTSVVAETIQTVRSRMDS